MSDYSNTGRLFKNTYKEAGDKKPDYTGDLTDEHGKKWRLAAWVKDGDRGKWMSLSVSEPREAASTPTSTPPLIGGGDIDDEVPFGPV